MQPPFVVNFALGLSFIMLEPKALHLGSDSVVKSIFQLADQLSLARLKLLEVSVYFTLLKIILVFALLFHTLKGEVVFCILFDLFFLQLMTVFPRELRFL